MGVRHSVAVGTMSLQTDFISRFWLMTLMGVQVCKSVSTHALPVFRESEVHCAFGCVGSTGINVVVGCKEVDSKEDVAMLLVDASDEVIAVISAVVSEGVVDTINELVDNDVTWGFKPLPPGISKVQLGT